MELQKKFEELIGLSDLNVVYTDESEDALEKETITLAKECTKLCLREQIDLLIKCGITSYIDELELQLNQLEDESME